MTPRQHCLRIIADLDAELFDDSDNGDGLRLTVWAPIGRNWVAGIGNHALTVWFATDRPAGWRALLEDLRLGLTDCTGVDCDTCHPKETAMIDQKGRQQ